MYYTSTRLSTIGTNLNKCQNSFVGVWICFYFEIASFIALHYCEFCQPVVCELFISVKDLQPHNFHIGCIFFDASFILQTKELFNVAYQDQKGHAQGSTWLKWLALIRPRELTIVFPNTGILSLTSKTLICTVVCWLTAFLPWSFASTVKV